MRAARQHAEVNEAAFFQAGDHLNFPSGSSAYPVQKRAAVARVAQGAGCDHAYAVGAMGLRSAMKSPQHTQRVGHCLRIKYTLGENAFAQACDFAVFVEGFEAAVYHLGYFEPDRVRTDVNRGKCGHAMLDTEKYQ